MASFFARQTALARAASAGRAPDPPTAARCRRAMANLSYDDILARKVVFGTAPRHRAAARLATKLGLDGIVAELNPGVSHSARAGDAQPADPHRDVLPALR